MGLVAVIPMILVEKLRQQTTQLQDTAGCGAMEKGCGGFVRLTTAAATPLTTRVVSTAMVTSTATTPSKVSSTAAASGFAQL